MTNPEGWVELSEYLSGNKALIQQLTPSMRHYCLAVDEFNRRFITQDALIPTSVLPKFELPLILPTHCLVNEVPLQQAILEIIPRLSVSRIQVCIDDKEWDPREESITSFINGNSGQHKRITRTVRTTPNPRVVQWWEMAFNMTMEQETVCGSHGKEEKNNKQATILSPSRALH